MVHPAYVVRRDGPDEDRARAGVTDRVTRRSTERPIGGPIRHSQTVSKEFTMQSSSILDRARSLRVLLAALLIGVLGLIGAAPAGTTSAGGAHDEGERPTIVLVHGS